VDIVYPRDMWLLAGRRRRIALAGHARIAVHSSSTTRRRREHVLHGDKASEAFLSEIIGRAADRRQAVT